MRDLAVLYGPSPARGGQIGLSAPPPAAGRSASKAEQIYRDLRREIRELILPPGAQIDRHGIARAHAASRTPVNAAIARLAEEGLIHVHPRHASFVAPIRGQDLRESFLICSALEVEGVRRTVKSADHHMLQRLELQFADQQAALASHDLPRFRELDDELHAGIFMTWAYPRARRILRAARMRLERALRLAQPEPEWAQSLLKEHRIALDAVQTGDPVLAAAAIRQRLARTAEILERALVEPTSRFEALKP